MIQIDPAECGVACLASILDYYGKAITLESLREECGVSRDGSNALNLIKAARHHGMIAQGMKFRLDRLRDLDAPTILFWNFNHFVILEGFTADGRSAWINDPVSGHRKVSRDELNSSFTGLALTMKPGTGFKPSRQKRSMATALYGRLRGLEGPAIFLFLTGLFLVVPGLVVPAFARIFIDDFLVGGEEAWLKPLVLGMGVTLLLLLALNFLQQHYLLRLQTRVSLTTSCEFFWHVLHLPCQYFGQRYAGEIGSRVALNDDVAELLAGNLIKIVLDLMMIIFFALLMAGYDLVLTGIVLGFSFLNLVTLQLVRTFKSESSQRILVESGKLTATSINGISMMETLKASAAEDEFFFRWAGLQAKSDRATQEQNRIDLFVELVPVLLGGLSAASVLTVGGFRIMDGLLTAGSLVAFQALAASFTAPIQSLMRFGSKLQTLDGAMRRLDDVTMHPTDRRFRTQHEIPLPAKLHGRMELRNVTFGYSKMEQPLIENFNLTIEPGQRVALVGGSGSGKSTVARLATALFYPWSGDVLIDGVAIEQIPRSIFAASIGVVDQEIILFDGTIRENLTLWNPSISDDRLSRACRDAEIEAEIHSRPSGLESKVLENGRNFSGGQRQRLELARALANDPTFLILDEATSAMDSETERAIYRNLRRRGCGYLLVSHRLSALRDVDEIVVMDDGRLVQRGSFTQLVAEPGVFRSLITE